MPADAAPAEHRVQSPGRQQYDPRAEAQPPAARAASAKRKQPGGPAGSRMQRSLPAAGLNGHAFGSGPVGAAASRATAVTAALQQLTDSGSDGGHAGNGGRLNGEAGQHAGSGSVTRIHAPPLQHGHPAAASHPVAVNGNAPRHGDGGSPSTCSMQPAPPPPTPQSAALQLPADLVLLDLNSFACTISACLAQLAKCNCHAHMDTSKQDSMCN